MALLRIALLQLASAGRDRDANCVKGIAFCRRAAALGADVALFPELWSIGYQPHDAARDGDLDAWRALAVPRDGAFVAAHAALARELSMAIGVTYLEAWPHAPRNALTLFDRRGDAVLHYAKTHLCPWGPPDDQCTAGDALPVATLDTRAGSVQVSALICFDREFPEAARVLALAGAELVLVSNACDLDDRSTSWGDVRIAQLRVRAFENFVAAAMANYAAPQNDGHSVAFHPDGTTIVQADAGEAVVVADFDLALVRELREREAGRAGARRPELYGPITFAKPR
jgi:predicted amidohydrolase